MRVAMIGLGKLGLPVSCAMVTKGHEVFGYERDTEKAERYREDISGLYEPDMDKVLRWCLRSGLHIENSLFNAIHLAEIIFVAVPTPSNKLGAFNTITVEEVLFQIESILQSHSEYKVIAVISTVLPQTCRSKFLPILKGVGETSEAGKNGFAYNAQFIAMGSVMENMLHPEFVLVGEFDKKSGDVLEKFYGQLTDAPVLRMSIENAEMTKMVYNCYISQKIVLANTIMEMTDKIPNADCDVVSNALAQATDRIVSSRYMKGGMCDSGLCHPRDSVALSYLAQQLNLRVDPFDFVTKARDSQTRYLTDIVGDCWKAMQLPVAILGLTFKPKTNVTEDSPALLLIDQLNEYGIICRAYDPITKPKPLPNEPHIYVITTRHEELKDFLFVQGSIIIDPWRLLDEAPEGCFLRSIGRHNG